jgi:hypothetical protein
MQCRCYKVPFGDKPPALDPGRFPFMRSQIALVERYMAAIQTVTPGEQGKVARLKRPDSGSPHDTAGRQLLSARSQPGSPRVLTRSATTMPTPRWIPSGRSLAPSPAADPASASTRAGSGALANGMCATQGQATVGFSSAAESSHKARPSSAIQPGRFGGNQDYRPSSELIL